MKPENWRPKHAPLRHRLQALLIALGIALAGQPAQALTNALTITTTTYTDSRPSNQTLNYGHAHTVKVLIDNNVTSDGSMCRGLLQLPPQIWAYPPEQILSATVVFYVWQDNTGSRNVTLYPLTRSFVQGTGTGTSPADGATWLTYDGAQPWTNPGGDFDSGCPVVGVKGNVLDPDENDRFFSWDITALLKTSTSRAELQNYGAMLRIEETPVPDSGLPRAPFTSSYDPSYPPAYWPSLQFTLAPTLSNVSVSGGAISFSIGNLTVGATNTIERSFNLATSGWTAVSSLVAASTSTNWSETLQPGWTKAFYRLHSQD
jgi:hypothetical protein